MKRAAIPADLPRRLRGAGFTLVELVICIGIVLILLGLLAPSISRSMNEARLTADAGTLKQNVALVMLYCNDHSEVFPVSDALAFRATDTWYKALDLSAAEVDPYPVKRFGEMTMRLSVCMVYDAEHMLPGRTLAPGEARSTDVRLAQVVYPSDKGLMLKFRGGMSVPRIPGNVTHMEGVTGQWCCGPRWRTPVAMTDCSILTTDYLTLTGGEYPLVVDLVGMPVFSTWGGYLGRDR